MYAIQITLTTANTAYSLIVRKRSGGGGGGGGAIQALKVRYDVGVQGGANASVIELTTLASGTYVTSVYVVQAEAFVKGPGDPPLVKLGLLTPTDLATAYYNQAPWSNPAAVLLQAETYLPSGGAVTLSIDESNDVGLLSGKYDIIVLYFTPSAL